MSQLQVTKITTVDNTTPLILATGNAGGGQIIVQSSNTDVFFNGNLRLSSFVTGDGSGLLLPSSNVANAAFNTANAAYASANNVAPQVTPAFNTANVAFDTANAAFASANNVAPQVTPAFSTANNAYFNSNAAFIHANAAFDSANNVAPQLAPAFNTANSAFATANIASNTAIAAYNDANAAYSQANAAYSHANTKFSSSGGSITGAVEISGDLTVRGNTRFIDQQTLAVGDSLIYLAANNYSSDVVDIGFVANYVNTGGSNVHTGLYRSSGNKEYYLFQGYDKEPYNNYIDPAGNNFTLAVLNADIITNNLFLGGANAINWIGSAFAKANASGANVGQTAPTGVTSGKLWWNSDLGKLFVYYTDPANTSSWIETSPSASAIEGSIITGYINPVYNTVNAAYTFANSAYASINSNWTVTNAAFDKANAALANTSGVYTAGDLNVPGTLSLKGSGYIDLTGMNNGYILKNTAAVFYFGNAGDKVANNPFWLGYQFASKDVITQSGSNRFPRTSFYYTYTTQTDPTDLTFVIEGGNSGSLPHGLSFRAAGGGGLSNITMWTAGTERVRITSGGNVGIATGSPQFTLDVNGSVRSTTYFYNSITGLPQYVMNSSGLNYGFIQNDAAGIWSLAYGTNPFAALGTSVLSWNSSGQVGIGTISQDYPLTIQAPSSGTGISIRGRSTDSASLLTFMNYPNTIQLGKFEVANNYMAIHVNASERIRIDSSGNVGIGSSTPQQKLEVVGLINSCDTAGQNRSYIGWKSGSPYSETGLHLINMDNSGLMLGTNNTVRARIDVNGVFAFNSGYGSVQNAYGCRIWGVYNSSGSSLRNSGGVSSVTRNGTGDITVNFSITTPDNNYNIVATPGGDPAYTTQATVTNFGRTPNTQSAPATGSCRMSNMRASDAAALDNLYIAFTIIR